MPTLRVTIDIFSGRENPVIELRGADAKAALARLQPARRLSRKDAGLPPQPTLGYRGLVIDQVDAAHPALPKRFRLAHGDLFGARLNSRAADETFEDYLLSDARLRKLGLGAKFPADLRKEMARFRELRESFPGDKAVVWPVRVTCPCAPLYEPGWWNVPARQTQNNCYNYATNYRTNTFAQPGRAAGAQATVMSCASVRPAAVKDELIDSPAANNKCPKEGHLVALVIWPNVDYHWYRKGRNGLWTHKPGQTPVTNVDNGGATISDPRTANRGGYTVFCTFMVVMHGHTRIS